MKQVYWRNTQVTVFTERNRRFMFVKIPQHPAGGFRYWYIRVFTWSIHVKKFSGLMAEGYRRLNAR